MVQWYLPTTKGITMDTIPTPTDIASRLPKNRAEVGDTIVYRDPATALLTEMLVEGRFMATDRIHRVYVGWGNRLVSSRYVTEVRKS